jgi:hypothetical protein
MEIRIVKRPVGEAPENIRDAWIGLRLPVLPNYPRIVYFGSGRSVRGYSVDPTTAINLLKKANPLAAAWWLTNTPQVFTPERCFVFDEECCVTEPAE